MNSKLWNESGPEWVAAAGAMSGRTNGGCGCAAVLAAETAVSVTATFDRKTSTKNALCEIIITFYANSTTLRSLSLSPSRTHSLLGCGCVCLCLWSRCVHICMMARMWADEVGMSAPLASTPWLGNFRCAVCLIKAANANKNENKF